MEHQGRPVLTRALDSDRRERSWTTKGRRLDDILNLLAQPRRKRVCCRGFAQEIRLKDQTGWVLRSLKRLPVPIRSHLMAFHEHENKGTVRIGWRDEKATRCGKRLDLFRDLRHICRSSSQPACLNQGDHVWKSLRWEHPIWAAQMPPCHATPLEH